MKPCSGGVPPSAILALVVVATCMLLLSQAADVDPQFRAVGFQNRYYQVSDYQGSRVLEHNMTGRFAEYVEVLWTQSAALDGDGRIWIADRAFHQVVLVPKETRYVKFPAYYVEYAGTRGTPGHRDGSRKIAMFDSPSGISVVMNRNQPVIFVADTNNHCVRRLDYLSGRTQTIVGFAGRSGMADGAGIETRFTYPMSIGVDSAIENLFVLDNGNRIRHVDLTKIPPVVSTLVHGACRALPSPPHVIYSSIVARTVACHPDWHAVKAGETTETIVRPVMCMGHISTCKPRNHPALADGASQYLQAPPPALKEAVYELPSVQARLRQG